MRRLQIIMIAAIITFAGGAHATPSTQIWIPSTDIQGFGTAHFGADTYGCVIKDPTAKTGSTINYGLTVGVMPDDDRFGVEVGVDYRDLGGNTTNPWYLNVKAGVKEGAFGEMMPAIAVGGFDFGAKSTTSTTTVTDFRTDNNIIYGVIAKTFGMAGRISLGYFSGNDKLLLDETGTADNTGILASWDKALNDKWWAAVDYMGGKSGYGALSYGIAYNVSANSSLILGFDIYNNDKLHDPTFTFQYDMNF